MRRAAPALALVLSASLVLLLIATGCANKDAVRPGGAAGTVDAAAETSAPDTRELAETIRRMREAKASEESVREAVGSLRNERESRSAVRAVRSRVVRRIDLSAPSSQPAELSYARAVYEKISGRWQPGVGDKGAATAGNRRAAVRVRIDKEGKVTDVNLEESSGNRLFDESALRAVRRASPLPAPPEKLREKEDLFEVVIRFGEGPQVPR